MIIFRTTSNSWNHAFSWNTSMRLLKYIHSTLRIFFLFPYHSSLSLLLFLSYTLFNTQNFYLLISPSLLPLLPTLTIIFSTPYLVYFKSFPDSQTHSKPLHSSHPSSFNPKLRCLHLFPWSYHPTSS